MSHARRLILPDPVMRTLHERPTFQLLGNIKRPGSYPLVKNARLMVSEAIAAAGGIAKAGVAYTCEIIRRNDHSSRQPIRLDLLSILSGRSPEYQILPGDVIRIERSGLSV